MAISAPVAIGDGMVRYQVVGHNAGAVEAPLTVRLTLPAHAAAGLEASDAATGLEASDAAAGLEASDVAAVANAVEWKNIMAAGETRTHTLAGRVDRATGSRSLDVTACVHDRLNAPAAACATDRNEPASAQKDPQKDAQKDDSRTRRMAWIGSIVFGILAVLGAVWLYRKVKPKLLTPTSADRPAAQPGGAPSE